MKIVLAAESSYGWLEKIVRGTHLMQALSILTACFAPSRNC